MTAESRYSRQELLFGTEGQARIAALKVAVIGLGGLGSHVVQQLAYLGVLNYALVDHDRITTTSLNRLVGGFEADVTARRYKVELAERMIRSIQPEAEVATVSERIDEEVFNGAVVDADIVFGCVDNHLARLQLTNLCADVGTMYVDLASDTGEEDGSPWYGGQVVFSFEGRGCLSCRDLLDQREMTRADMTAAQREQDDRLYGVKPDALSETGPSVVSVNGVVASLGVTEFMAWATRLRDPWPHLTYRGDQGRVALNIDPPREDCFYCRKYASNSGRPGAA